MTKQQLQLKCPKCRSSRLRKRGAGFTASGRHQRWECKNCGYLTIVPLKSVKSAKKGG